MSVARRFETPPVVSPPLPPGVSRRTLSYIAPATAARIATPLDAARKRCRCVPNAFARSAASARRTYGIASRKTSVRSTPPPLISRMRSRRHTNMGTETCATTAESWKNPAGTKVGRASCHRVRIRGSERRRRRRRRCPAEEDAGGDEYRE